MIELIIQKVIAQLPPSSGDNLTGFEIDADHYFGSTDAFASVSVSRMKNSSCMLEMRAEIAEHVASLQQISGVLSEIWRQLAYSYFEASSCQWYKDSTILRFVTVASKDLYHVTGRMVVGGGHYSKLVETFKNHFGHELPSSPPAG